MGLARNWSGKKVEHRDMAFCGGGVATVVR